MNHACTSLPTTAEDSGLRDLTKPGLRTDFMMIARRGAWLAIMVAAALPAAGAAYSPAAAAKVDWTPNVASGVGVPGGIPARPTIHTTLTATGDNTDRRGAIEAALAACPAGQTVLLGPGTFYISTLSLANHTGGGYTSIGGKTLRGSGDSTILRLTGSGGITLRGSSTYNSPYSGSVTGTPTKGDSTLSVTNASAAIVGRLMELSTEDDDSLPVINVSGNGYNRRQVVLITAVNGGAGTISFQPALYQTPVKRTGGALSMGWAMHHDGQPKLTGAGLEDLTIDNTSGSAQKCLSLSGAHGCWIKGVRVLGVLNYGIEIVESSQCEMRGSLIGASRDPSWVSSNHAGLTLSVVSASLFEDNVILPNFPLIEAQGGAISGNVFGYNFGIQGANVVPVNASHNSGNYCNLWEGNSISGWATDGYFGSAADEVLYRNDWHGVILNSTIPDFPVFLARFARRIEVVGNQLGRAGTTLNVSMGIKTRFNFSTVGVANNYGGDPHDDILLTGVLSTRTSNTDGVVTLDNTLGTLGVGGSSTADVGLIGIRWGNSASYSLRNNATRGTINTGSKTVAFSGGYGPDLPAQGTAVRIYTGPNGYLETDNAVAASTVLLGNNYASAGGTIPSGQALGSTTLPDSLYRTTKPDFLNGYNWPPYDPSTPDRRYDAIPAGYRYLNPNAGGPANAAPATVRVNRR